MRVVLDTNVLIASFIARGTAHKLLAYCARQHTIVASPFILDELHEKLIGKFKYSLALADEVIQLLRSKLEIIDPAPLENPVCRDPEDDNILATAVSANCSRIITGDKDLLVLQRYNSIAIVSPADFLREEGVEN